MSIAVIGAGIAGVACAWALRRRGLEVLVFEDRAGASVLSSGALDWAVCGPLGELEPFTPELMAFSQSFEAWSVTSSERVVATQAGVVRRVHGIDTGLLDLEPLAGRNIGVVDPGLRGFDGNRLARALSASSWAQATRTTFGSVAVELDGCAGALVPDADLSRRFESEPGRAALVAALNGRSGYDGWLLGAWLGTDPVSVAATRASVAAPIGEVTSQVGGSAGLRFVAARDRLLAGLGVRRIGGRVLSVASETAGHRIRVATDDGRVEEQVASEVVLAVGGVAGGGISVGSAETGQLDRARFALSLGLQVDFELDGRSIDCVSSLHGVDVQALGMAALERIGIANIGGRVRGCTGVYVAGDALPGAERSMLSAAQSGISAAALCAR